MSSMFGESGPELARKQILGYLRVNINARESLYGRRMGSGEIYIYIYIDVEMLIFSRGCVACRFSHVRFPNWD